LKDEDTPELISSFDNNSKAIKQKRNYMPVEQAKRNQLIQLVQNDQITIKDAASHLQINYSTAKHIIKTYKKE